MNVSRRWLAAFAIASVLAMATPTSIDAQTSSAAIETREIRLAASFGEARVLLTHARRPFAATERIPILVALHGAGEARRGPDRGYLGWVDDYELPVAFAALGRGRLRSSDYGEMVRAEHLAARNRALRARPFRDVLVVTPYTPNLMSETPGSDAIRAYGNWIAGPLLEAVRSAVPSAARTRAGTGIDGVSLGGMLALEVGLRHPEAFGAVGAIQPAVRGRVDAIAPLADGSQQLRLVSSDDDPFLVPTRELAAALEARSIPSELVVTPGPHGYDFNRGPGGVELLFFHDRALSRETP